MKLVIVKNYEELSNAAYQIVTKAIRTSKKIVLGLATGATPEGLYQKLIKNRGLDWSNVVTFNLDEYIGLKPSDPMSYRYYMNDKLFNHVGINKKNTYVPLGTGAITKNAREYQKLIDAQGGINLQILGIGSNGHIAFNEPGASPKAKMSIVELAQSTINANGRYFKQKSAVPTKAITMGIGTILNAKAILLLASGSKKAKAIKAALENNITSAVPASYLQSHPNVTVILDRAAAKFLSR